MIFSFLDRVPLYSSGCPGTYFVDQAGLPSAEVKGMCHHTKLNDVLLVKENYPNIGTLAQFNTVASTFNPERQAHCFKLQIK